MDTVEYLGFILTPTGLHMDPTKVPAIQGWPEPRNVRYVQSFLGFKNFYCCFIADYPQLTLPLTNLCKKATPWNFGKMEATTFRLIAEERFLHCPSLVPLGPGPTNDSGNRCFQPHHSKYTISHHPGQRNPTCSLLLLLPSKGRKELRHS